MELLSFSRWLVYLQHVSDLCYHTDSETLLKVLDDYRIDAELGAEYDRTHEKEIQRRAISKAYDMRGDESDKEYFERVKKAFLNDTGVHFNIFEAVMHQLAGMHFEKEIVRYEEPVPNVIVVDAEAVIEEGVEFVGDNTTKEEVRKAYELLTIDETKLKTLQGEGTSVLPIWDRENRDNCFAVKPLVRIEDDIIFSPTVVDALRNRWINGFFQFYPPYEIGLNLTCAILWEWKNHYEHLFSSDVEDLLKKSGCEYAKHDIDLRREDRNGNHPTIDKIGDYDVIGLNIKNKTIYIIECSCFRPLCRHPERGGSKGPLSFPARWICCSYKTPFIYSGTVKARILYRARSQNSNVRSVGKQEPFQLTEYAFTTIGIKMRIHGIDSAL